MWQFQRRGTDLVMPMRLTLVEALCGFQKAVKTLDGRALVVHCLPGEVVADRSIKCVLGEGMPVYRDPFEKGRLVLQFSVAFPEAVDPAQAQALEACLPPRQEALIPDGAEPVALQPFDPASQRRGGPGGVGGSSMRGQAYDSDDEEGGPGGQRVQCASH